MKRIETHSDISEVLDSTRRRIKESSELLSGLKRSVSEITGGKRQGSRQWPGLHLRSKSQDTALTCLNQDLSLMRRSISPSYSPNMSEIQRRIEGLEGKRERSWRHHWEILEKVYARRCGETHTLTWDCVNKQEILGVVMEIKRFIKERYKKLTAKLQNRTETLEKEIKSSIPMELNTFLLEKTTVTPSRLNSLRSETLQTACFKSSECSRVWKSIISSLYFAVVNRLNAKFQEFESEFLTIVNENVKSVVLKTNSSRISAKFIQEKQKLEQKSANLNKFPDFYRFRRGNFDLEIEKINRKIENYKAKNDVFDSFFSDFMRKIAQIEQKITPKTSNFALNLKKERLKARLQVVNRRIRLRKAKK